MEVIECRDLLLTVVPYLETEDLVCMEVTSLMLRSLFSEGGVWWEVAHTRDNSAALMKMSRSILHLRQVKLALKSVVNLSDCFHSMQTYEEPGWREEWQLAQSACHVRLIMMMRDYFTRWVKKLPPVKPTQLLPAHHLLFPVAPTTSLSYALAKRVRAKPITPPSPPVFSR